MNAINDKRQTKFEQWGLVELMGHQRVAGLVSEENIAGKMFLRVDVPNDRGETLFSRFYSPDAVYCINPTDRQIAIALAARCESKPVNIYDLANLAADKKLGAGEERYSIEDLES